MKYTPSFDQDTYIVNVTRRPDSSRYLEFMKLFHSPASGQCSFSILPKMFSGGMEGEYRRDRKNEYTNLKIFKKV